MKQFRYFLLTKSVGLYINLLSYLLPMRAQALSYKLFSSPREGRLSTERLPEVLQKARRWQMEFESELTQCYEWGTGPNLVLLLHGWESNASRWELLLPHLDDPSIRILAIDAPAHGLSGGKFNLPRYAALVNSVVKSYAPKAIVGHSLGGITAMYFAYRYAGAAADIQKLVLLGTPADFSPIVNNYTRLLRLGMRSRGLFSAYFQREFSYLPEEFTAREFAKNLEIPGIIAHDILDDIVLPVEAQKIAEVWKQGKLITTKGFGHSLHDEALYAEIREFLLSETQLHHAI